MVTVQILEPHDRIDPEDWCRPLSLCSMSGGMSDGYSFKSMYSGTPENNVKWVKVKHQFGKCRFGDLVSEINTGKFIDYEFARGEIPEEHRLNMTGYNRINRK